MRPTYDTPHVETVRMDDLLGRLGPAQANSYLKPSITLLDDGSSDEGSSSD